MSFIKTKKIFVVFIGIAFSILILLFSSMLYVKNEVYYGNNDRPILSQEASQANRQILDYINSKNNFLPGILKEREKTHLSDVKVLVKKLLVFSYSLFFVILISLPFAFYNDKKGKIRNIKLLIKSALVTNCILLAFLIVVGIFFDKFFILFHKLFFNPGTWTFFVSDTLIILYPQSFFIKSFIIILINYTAVSVILLLIYSAVHLPRKRLK